MTPQLLSDEQLTRWLAEETLALCAIPSVTGDEAAIADHLVTRVRELQPQAEQLRVGNTVMVRCGRRGAARIGLFGHSDTVPPNPAQPHHIDWEAGRIYGLGSSDMKSGLAVMLRLIADAESLPMELVCVFYDREEGPVNQSGMVPLCAEQGELLQSLAVAVCLEPTDNRVEAGCSGSLQAQVMASGKRAHSARPWLGQNAIYAAAPLLQKLATWQRRPVERLGLTFYEVMSATQILTENARNVIPDRVMVNVNYRFCPGKSLATAEAELREFIGPDYAVHVVDACPSGAVCTDHPILARWITDCGLPVTAKQAWTDVARLTGLGIPAVNCGPGDPEQAHKVGEWCSLAGPLRNYHLLRRLLS